MPAKIASISELLQLNLRVPNYQRPYRWTEKNVLDLLNDMEGALEDSKAHPDFKYRLGTIILHENEGYYDLVDGQQRVLSLVLLMLAIDPTFSCPLLDESKFSNRETQRNIQSNHALITDWVRSQPRERCMQLLQAFAGTFEAVIITVEKVEEAFQLFDSQNTRGRELDPHDLLKAFHLRAMRGDDSAMAAAVRNWEAFDPDDIATIFSRFLFPIAHWTRLEKTTPFTVQMIDAFKGVGTEQGYSYALRAQAASPHFQVGSAFIEGNDFFRLVEHYLRLKEAVVAEINSGTMSSLIKKAYSKKGVSIGYKHARNLFICALFAYYDRFHNFDERAVRKLFLWSFAIRIDMRSLGFDSVNKYAVGENNGRFTNVLPMFSLIGKARNHGEIANLVIRIPEEAKGPKEEGNRLVSLLRELSEGDDR